jgi:ethanolamine utilization protein EutJ
VSNLEKANKILTDFQSIVTTDSALPVDKSAGIKVGVDLGTSSIVLVVLNQDNQPIFGAFEYADVIRDGLVVNYQKAVEIVTRLKEKAEARLGVALKVASGAVPPGTVGNNKRVVANVIESAGMLADQLVDEPTAAAQLLELEKGAVIDVGGGTTGISIIENGRPIIVEDEATGGTHMSLVIAGYHRISLEEAELRKRKPKLEAENFTIVRPVIQRMAEISRQVLLKHPIEPVIVVGGAAYFSEFEKELSTYLQQKVEKPVYPQFVTPIGIAMCSQLVAIEEEVT